MHRRHFLARLLALLPALIAPPATGASAQPGLRKALPRGGPLLPVIGLGTWLTFDVGDDYEAMRRRSEVLRRFLAHGGGMVDSSPMYGRAEWLLGRLLAELPGRERVFSATKIWTPLDAGGPRQLEDSLRLWGLPGLDVVLVHNLLNWRAHLKTLRAARERGLVRYIGISTSHGRRHDEVAELLRDEPLDVLQITYNLVDESAEPLLRQAAERGVAVVVNRPFDGGNLFHRVSGRPLPPWAAEIDCANWAQFFLKWVVSHPAVTCAIPATSNPDHLDENMGAGLGRMPNAAMRRRMREYFQRL
jgi:diketogulonate reductase-like aldo/keto reductase